MASGGPRQTEERLRHYLDNNQPMRERLCLALMPLIGPYARERPRRPKGGRDGGRDIEAIRDSSIVVWGAVGFRNGGGNDNQARQDASKKFKLDLASAIKENPALQAFVFFTNVDLTPAIVEQLKEHAASAGISQVDIVDLERLRHVLDSPEGLIARLQYLDIVMSKTEQITLVNKFGSQLQNAVAARFDRVEQTLSKMERFLDFQKPIYRLDLFVELEGQHRSSELGSQGVLFKINGFQDLNKSTFLLMWNHTGHKNSDSQLITWTNLWLGERKDKVISFAPSIGRSLSTMTAYCELSLISGGGHRVRIADLSMISFSAFATEGLYPYIRRFIVDANGYELFNCSAATVVDESSVELPDTLAGDAKNAKWFRVVNQVMHELTFAPPAPSGRLLPLHRLSH